MNTLSPYDREFLALNGIAPEKPEPEYVVDPEPGPVVFIGVRNALIFQLIVAVLIIAAYVAWKCWGK